MKNLILFLFFCTYSLSLSAQLKLISSNPANGAVAVNQDSIVLEFNLPVMINPDDPDESGFYFFIEPEDQITPSHITVNEDRTKVTYHGVLQDDVDYLAILENAMGMQGEKLESPHIFQFTTADQAGEYTISGTLTEEAMEKLKIADTYNGFIVAVADIPLLFEVDMYDDYDEENPPEEEDPMVFYAATVDTSSGDYEVNGVREGTYYPFAINVFQLQELDYNEFFFPDIYYFDPDGDFVPDSIDVNQATTTENELAEINLILFDFSPITYSDAASLAQNVLAELDNDPVLAGGYTEYTYLWGQDIYYKNRDDSPLFNSRIRSLNLSVKPSGNVFNSSFSVRSKADSNNPFEVISTPTGKHILWEVYAYDAVKDSIIFIEVTPLGAEFMQYIGLEEAELPEGISFSDLKLLPETYIDSDEAARIMEENGGANFRKGFEMSDGGIQRYWDMELQLLHEYWAYTPDPTPNAPLFWKGKYIGISYDYDDGSYTEDSLNIFIDITTGEILYSETSLQEAISFGEAFSLARAALQDLENDPILVAGSAHYWYQPPFYYQPMYKPNKAKSSAFMASVSSSSANYYGRQFKPNGFQVEWEIYGYDAVKDSAFGFGVTADSVTFGGYIGVDEAELPAGVTFSSIKPVPENFIDSDSAAAIAELAGGERFRNRYNTSNEDHHPQWDMWLQAMHEYWTYEPNPTEDAPVFWKATYHAYDYIFETESAIEDSMVVFIDVQTGDVLYTVVSNETNNEVPTGIELLQNYPNPFNPSTSIPFSINQPALVKLTIYNMLGQKVSTLINEQYSAGTHIFTWNAQGLASGVYFYRLEAGGIIQTRKMLLLK